MVARPRRGLGADPRLGGEVQPAIAEPAPDTPSPASRSGLLCQRAVASQEGAARLICFGKVVTKGGERQQLRPHVH